MSQKFDWRSEDEDKWNEFATVDDSGSRRPPGGRRWLRLIMAIFLLVSTAILVFQQVNRYISETATSVEGEILSSRDLVLGAASSADVELLATVLSGRDPSWTQSQLSLLNQGLLYDHQAMGLNWQIDAPPIDVEVSVSPNLAEAEVTTRLAYLSNDENATFEVFTLDHTAVFRRSEERWLMSPPDGDFWGEPITVKGRFVALTFPTRDEMLGRRLAADLEEVLVATCITLEGLECTPELHVSINLATNPDAMFDVARPEARLKGGQEIVLPALSLIGVPVDEAGYRAIYRGYAERVVGAFLTQAAGWQCCEHVLFYQALLDLQLTKLDLRSWPLTEQHYRQVLEGKILLDEALWASGPEPADLLGRPDSWLAYVLVEYIEADWAKMPITEMQRRLTVVTYFPDWLMEIAGEGVGSSFAEGWRAFLLRRAGGVLDSHSVA